MGNLCRSPKSCQSETFISSISAWRRSSMFSWRGVSPALRAHGRGRARRDTDFHHIAHGFAGAVPQEGRRSAAPGNQQAVDAAGQHGAIGIGKARLHAADKQLIAVDMAVFAGDAVRKRGALLRILIGHRVFSDDAARVAHAQNAAQLIDKAALHARERDFHGESE